MAKTVLFSVLAYFFITAHASHALVVTLNEEMVSSAKAYGIEHSKSIPAVLHDLYGVDKNDVFTEWLLVRSKWYKLAALAARKHRHAEHISSEDQAQIVNDDALQIDVIAYGRKLDFARDYRVEIVQAGRVIEPVKIHADHFQNAQTDKNSMRGFPCCTATIRSYFEYASIDPAQKADVILKKNGRQKTFTLDFSGFK